MFEFRSKCALIVLVGASELTIQREEVESDPALLAIAAAWSARADELAKWIRDRLIMRSDAWGAYGTDGPYTAKGDLSDTKLRQHFRATRSNHVIGLHTGSPGPEATAKWIACDIDAHDGQVSDPEANWRAAEHWYTQLVDCNFTPLLTDSNGAGGYHLRVIFSDAIPLHVAHYFANWIFATEEGFPSVEVFPKQSQLAGPDAEDGRYGNWLRVPGRHHSREHWSRVWDGSNWLSGYDAIDCILAMKGDDPTPILDAYAEFQAEQEAERKAKAEAVDAKIESRPSEADRHHLYGLAALKRACKRIADAPDLRKHFTLRDAAFSLGHLVPNFLTADEIQEALEQAIRDRGADNLKKACKTIRSGIEKGSKNPKPRLPEPPRIVWSKPSANGHAATTSDDTRKLIDALNNLDPHDTLPTTRPQQPFPTHVLPEVLATFVRESAISIGCDEANVALPVLAACAAAIGNTRQIRLKRGWTEPAIVWAALVGNSGEKKSPPFRAAMRPLFDIEHEYRELYKEQCLARNNLILSGGDKNGEPEPIMRRVLTEDTTIESVATILHENPRGIINARDEIDDWFQALTRYKGKNGGTDRGRWLKLSNADTLVFDRKTGDVQYRRMLIPIASCSIAGTIQPGVLRHSLDALARASGLAARLLLAMPSPRRSYWSEAEVSVDTERMYQTLIRDLFKLAMDTDAKDRPCARVLNLDKDAKEIWKLFYNRIQDEKADAEADIAAVLSKLEGYGARFSLIFHVIDEVWLSRDATSCVTAGAVQSGIKLAHWFAGEARRIYSALAETDEDRATRELIEWIQKRPARRSTARDLQHARGGSFPTAQLAEDALNALVKAELGKWVETPNPRGGHRRREFVLNIQNDNDTCDTRPQEQGSTSEHAPTLAPTIDNRSTIIPQEFRRVSQVSECGNNDWAC